MASLRKRYRPEPSVTSNEPPVTTAPTAVAQLQPAPETNPADEKSSPVRDAEQNAIAARVREMRHAEGLQREAIQHQPHYAAEPKPQAPAMPEPVQQWLSEHPQYLSDALAQAELNVATMKCIRDGLTWDHTDFVPTIERYLGLRQPSNGNGQVHDRPLVNAPTPAPRNAAPVRQHAGPPVSAPPTRDVPSMTTGRVSAPTRLTVEEAQLARSLGISAEDYQQQKEKMRRLQQAGAIQ